MKYAFCGGKLLDGTREMQPREGLVVLTDRRRPHYGHRTGGGRIWTGYEVVNLKGGYLMPGLINMHVHLAGSGKPQKKQRDNEKLVKTILLATGLTRAVAYRMVAGFAKEELFMRGVTTIRTVGGLADFDTRLRDEIRGRKEGWYPASWRPMRASPFPAATWPGLSRWRPTASDEALAQLEKGQAAGRGSHQADDHRRCAGRQGEGRARRAEDAAGDGEGGLREGAQAWATPWRPMWSHRRAYGWHWRTAWTPSSTAPSPMRMILRLFRERGAFLCTTHLPGPALCAV